MDEYNDAIYYILTELINNNGRLNSGTWGTFGFDNKTSIIKDLTQAKIAGDFYADIDFSEINEAMPPEEAFNPNVALLDLRSMFIIFKKRYQILDVKDVTELTRKATLRFLTDVQSSELINVPILFAYLVYNTHILELELDRNYMEDIVDLKDKAGAYYELSQENLGMFNENCDYLYLQLIQAINNMN